MSKTKLYYVPFTTKLSSSAKELLPEFLHGPARAVWRLLFRVRKTYRECSLWLTLWLHKKRGGKYIDWYAGMVDRSAKPAEFIMEQMPDWIYKTGADDLIAAERLGLKPGHTLHEFGCGFLRSGSHFIRYLDKGNYSGNDAAGARLDRAREIFKDLIREKEPTLYLNRDNTLDWVSRKVDYVWSHAVFGHMPEEDIEETIRNVRKIMHDNSVFLFSYDPPPSELGNGLVYREDSRDWFHSLRFYERIASENGMTVEDVSWAIRDLETWEARINLAKLVVKQPAAQRR